MSGKERKSKARESVAVWGCVLFQRALREGSADEKTFKRKSWRGEGLCRELKSISGRGKGKGRF